MGIPEDIDILETKIARLKIDYEQYFLRVVKKQPIQMRTEVDRLVSSYHGRVINNSSQKFRLNNLVAKYNSYRTYWTRTLRAIEEGTYHRQAEGAEGGMGNGIGGSTAALPPTQTRQTPLAQPQPAAQNPTDPADDIYNRYMAARKECNEATTGISRETLAKSVEDYKKKVMAQYNVKDVEVRVAIKDGKSKLLIVPKK